MKTKTKLMIVVFSAVLTVLGAIAVVEYERYRDKQ